MPELVHGLRNLIQNAVDFAASTVWIDADWTAHTLTLRIIDDGPGFPPQVLGRIGDPFVRQRRSAPEREQRPGYEGMGLGLFIAKTLLERLGAEISFANAADTSGGAAPGARRGAIVELILPRARVSQEPGSALGENRPILP
jgi:two-component system sensor histidine kinase RegB